MNLDALLPFADQHHGLVTRAAAARLGISIWAWYRALDSGLLVPVHPGVARLPGAPVTRDQAIAAAVLAVGRGAIASHRSAAHLFRVPRPPDDPVDVILAERTRRATPLDGVIVHRPRDHKDLSPLRRQNIPCCVIVRWLCDLGAVDEPGVHPAVGHVLWAGLASPRDMLSAINVHTRRGRHGVPAFRAALEAWMIDSRPADSVLELTMRDLLVRYQLPPAEFHKIIGPFEVDFWIVGTPVLIECDGWQFHDRTKFQSDRDKARDVELIAMGYLPMHFTYRQIVRQQGWVANKIRAALRRTGSLP